MSKPWWKSERSLQAAHIRSMRKRLRAGYKRSLAVERQKLQAQFEIYKKAETYRANERIKEAEDEAMQVAKSIMDVRLHYEPKFTHRFTMYARMDENYVAHGGRLREVASYIIQRLAILIQHEFAQIDFARVKPIDFGPDAYRERGPTFEIAPKF